MSNYEDECGVHMTIVLGQWERTLSIPNQVEANRNITVLPLNQIVNINPQTAVGRGAKDLLIKLIRI